MGLCTLLHRLLFPCGLCRVAQAPLLPRRTTPIWSNLLWTRRTQCGCAKGPRPAPMLTLSSSATARMRVVTRSRLRGLPAGVPVPVACWPPTIRVIGRVCALLRTAAPPTAARKGISVLRRHLARHHEAALPCRDGTVAGGARGTGRSAGGRWAGSDVAGAAARAGGAGRSRRIGGRGGVWLRLSPLL